VFERRAAVPARDDRAQGVERATRSPGTSARAIASCPDVKSRSTVTIVALVVIASGCSPAPCEEARPLKATLARAVPAPAVVPVPVSIDPIGVAVCDDYIADFRRCIDERAPADAQPQLYESLLGTANSWRAVAQGAGREFLDETCTITAAGSRAATAALGCDWTGERQF
jgi:hypothetical protein